MLYKHRYAVPTHTLHIKIQTRCVHDSVTVDRDRKITFVFIFYFLSEGYDPPHVRLCCWR